MDYYYYYSSNFFDLFRGAFSFNAIIGILSIVGLWMVFKKANEEGWAAIIPFYNLFVLYKITWGSGWYFLLLLIPIANIVIYIITMVKLSKSFGKGGGWACGLIFLFPIFICIMAFDKSFVYVGEFAGTAGTTGNGQAAGTEATPPGSGADTSAASTAASAHTEETRSEGESYGGEPLQDTFSPEQTHNETPRFCSACGTPTNEGDKFCISCGNKLS